MLSAVFLFLQAATFRIYFDSSLQLAVGLEASTTNFNGTLKECQKTLNLLLNTMEVSSADGSGRKKR